MSSFEQYRQRTRREFLNTTASGLGAMALGSMLTEDGLLTQATAAEGRLSQPQLEPPFAPRAAHFPAKAKSCIFIFMAGAPSQLDLFNPKPKLNELHAKPLPKSIWESARFAFIKPDTAVL